MAAAPRGSDCKLPMGALQPGRLSTEWASAATRAATVAATAAVAASHIGPRDPCATADASLPMLSGCENRFSGLVAAGSASTSASSSCLWGSALRPTSFGDGLLSFPDSQDSLVSTAMPESSSSTLALPPSAQGVAASVVDRARPPAASAHAAPILSSEALQQLAAADPLPPFVPPVSVQRMRSSEVPSASLLSGALQPLSPNSPLAWCQADPMRFRYSLPASMAAAARAVSPDPEASALPAARDRSLSASPAASAVSTMGSPRSAVGILCCESGSGTSSSNSGNIPSTSPGAGTGTGARSGSVLVLDFCSLQAAAERQDCRSTGLNRGWILER